MKKLLTTCLGFVVIIVFSSCTGESSETLDKEFIKEKAEIGLSKSEVEEAFGKDYISGDADGGKLWLYDTTNKEGANYERRLDAVAHEDIIDGNVVNQLFINFQKEKAIMYSFFYKGDDGKVWEFVLNPDETTLEVPVSQ
ncbi:PhoU family transcriptional regulator [Candidatus Pristimantibacillus sp. PTI5]|uniref:PhoU family transcriptional regulator n=1 Tax=Candidatus Pristimantibacillus sp. PTI5 TaxID=3400422 RepID=UPI003B01D143